MNPNNNEYITNQEGIENEQAEEAEDNGEDDDDRLTYTLITLDLGNLIHIFEDNNISFVDLLLLTKEDLIELQLEIFQRNRILNFSKLFTKYAKNYSIREISDFFTFNKQFIFNSSIYDKVYSSNMNDFQNDMNNINESKNINNFEPLNQEGNYLNTEPNNNNNMNNINENNSNYLSQTITNKPNSNNIKTNKPLIVPKINVVKIKPQNQNINGANINEKKYKNINQKNINKNFNLNSNKNINNNISNQKQEEIPNKLIDVIKKKKVPKSNINNKGYNLNNNNNRINNTNNEINKNEEFQKIIEKIGLLENTEMNYDLYTKLNLIKNYINMKGDKMSSDDLVNIDNDIESMLNNNAKSNYNVNKNDINNKIRNKIKVAKNK